MCLKCALKTIMGLEDKPVGIAGNLALKALREIEFEKDRLEKVIKIEVEQAVEVIRVKHGSTYNSIESRRAEAWDLVKTQLGLDPNADCDININTGQVTQTFKASP